MHAAKVAEKQNVDMNFSEEILPKLCVLQAGASFMCSCAIGYSVQFAAGLPRS